MNDPEKNVEGMETHTRKTVKLKPLGQASANTNSRPVQQVIASPLQSRDTDTGNLSVMSDTQTRRTVKLKPLAPGGHRPVRVPAPAPAAAPVSVPPPASAEKQDDDITRKVAAVKPAVKPGLSSLSGTAPVSSGVPAAPSAPTVAMASSAPAEKKEDDDITRKVAAVKPAVKPGLSSLSGTAPVSSGVPAAPSAPTVAMASSAPAEKKEDDDITRKVAAVKPALKPGITLPAENKAVSPSKQTMVLPENDASASAAAVSPSKQTMVLPAEDDENSATVKIARPPSRMGMIPPKPALTPKPGLVSKPAPASPSAPTVPAVAKPEMPAADEAEEKKIPSLTKKLSVPKAADKPEEKAPEAQEEAPKKLGLKKKADSEEAAAGGPPMLDDVVVTRDEDEDASPSIFYTVITAVAVILLLASAAISAVNYLNLYEGQNIQLPGLSSTK